jgi:predicted transcriptional regulator
LRSDLQITEDACIIRGILELLREEPKPVTIRQVEFTQNIGWRTAKRLMTNLAAAGVIEHPIAKADILGSRQRVTCLGWQLTETAKLGQIPSAEELARGIT